MNARAVAACIVLPLVVVCARMAYEGRAALAEADRLAEHAEPAATLARVALLGKAARRALPFGPAAKARQALALLGRAGVVTAWDELRGAILATRALTTPSPELLDEANRAIAERRAVADSGATDPVRLAERRAFYLAQLERTDEPSRPLSLLALVGLAAFLGAAARLLSRGLHRTPLGVGAVGLVLFLVGLWRA